MIPRSAPRRRGTFECPTLIVSMPFMDAHGPSIQLGLLSAIGTLRGFPVTTLHANLDFAARSVSTATTAWLSIAASRSAIGCSRSKLSVRMRPTPTIRLLEHFAHRLELDDPPHSGESAADWSGPGPTTFRTISTLWWTTFPGRTAGGGVSSTFPQNAASFALARRLKAKFPDLVTIFGGANFDGDMGLELVRAVDVIDYAVIGEGDLAFPRMLDRAGDGRRPRCGARGRAAGGRPCCCDAARAALRGAGRTAEPDYEEYFRARGETRRHRRPGPSRGAHPLRDQPGLLVGREASLHVLRSQRDRHDVSIEVAGSVRHELAEQPGATAAFRFDAVDNIIDVGHLRTVLPALVQSERTTGSSMRSRPI